MRGLCKNNKQTILKATNKQTLFCQKKNKLNFVKKN